MVYLSKFPGGKMSSQNSRKTHDEISLKKFRKLWKKFIFTWREESCSVGKLRELSVVQSRRVGYLITGESVWITRLGRDSLPTSGATQMKEDT